MKLLKQLLCAAAIAFAGVANADALYWQVDTANAGAGGYSGEVAYAQLFAVAKDASFNYSGSKIALGDDAFVSVSADDKPYLTDLGGYGSSEYSFFVELYNNSGATVHTGYAVNYNDLVSSGYISTSGVFAPTALVTSGYNGASVPEPTSGMLLLMGGALLALRRRRQ